MTDEDDFPRFPIDFDISIPERSSKDTETIRFDKVQRILKLCEEINLYSEYYIDVNALDVSGFGSVQGNKFILELQAIRKHIKEIWTQHLKGRKELIEGKGFSFTITLDGSIQNEKPSEKQVSYLKYLFTECGVTYFPEYLFHALSKWDVSNILDSIVKIYRATHPNSSLNDTYR